MSGLIGYPSQIWLAVAPVDMRRGLDGLSAIVQHSLGHAPCAGSAFIFRMALVGGGCRLATIIGHSQRRMASLK